jgi:oxygen-independent coproporphyrinogen III oxidase
MKKLLQIESISTMSPQSLPGLYIHVPFCRTKCPYCDFYSCTDVQLVNDFIIALEKELLYYCKSFPAVDTVYLGGGTPTVLPDAALAAITAMVHRHVAVAPNAEITLEANPNDLNSERLANFRSFGFNRLSLGVQSFDDEVLQFLGRRHSAEEARRAIVFAREGGFDNISIDLMYGIPGQSQQDWFATLRAALRFAPAHLSCYQLTIKEETPFFACMQKGAFQLCTEEEQAELFIATSALLEESRYSHYEVSSFCRSDNLQARHNSIYWEHVPYLGLGPSAHSFDGRRRWWNVKSAAGYVEKFLSCSKYDEPLPQVVLPACPESLCCGGKDMRQAGMTGKRTPQEKQKDAAEQKELNSCFPRNDETAGIFDLPREGWEELSDKQLRIEALLLGLRTSKGIALDEVLTNPSASQRLERLKADGLVIVAANRIAPTTRGLLLADYVAIELSID